MKNFQRSIRIFILLALFTTVLSLMAQEASPVTVTGSGIVNPVVEALVTASGQTVNTSFSVTGTADGFTAFCEGGSQMTTANRVISFEENTLCLSNGVEFLELLLAHDILTIIASPQDNLLTCVTPSVLDSLFAPSATGKANWSDLNKADASTETQYPDLPLQIFAPADTSLMYAELDNLVTGVGLRDDLNTAVLEDILTNVSSTAGAIGVVPLEAALISSSPVAILDIDFGLGCTAPDAANVEEQLYSAATPFLLYVNKAEQGNFADLLNYLVSDETVTVLVGLGVTPATSQAYATNRALVSGEEVGRVFSSEDTGYVIPDTVAGDVKIGGSTVAYTVADTNANRLTANRATVTITKNFKGAADTTAFCAGELDILFVESASVACEGESPASVTFALGTRTVVLVSNAADDFATCLTLEQINTIWGASSTDTVENWSAVGEGFPDQAMTLFGVREGSEISDLLLRPLGGGVIEPVRVDTEISNDALYRAAAVANVQGSLTYMTASDYQKVLDNQQERIQLVALNAGDGCVQASDANYPLSQTASLVISQTALARPEVQAYVWTVFSAENINVITAAGFSAYSDAELSQLQDSLVIEFKNAEDAAAQALISPESTEEAVSAEATEEAVVEATEAATEEATAEATESTSD